jgi:hypothetical protein
MVNNQGSGPSAPRNAPVSSLCTINVAVPADGELICLDIGLYLDRAALTDLAVKLADAALRMRRRELDQ